MKMKNRSLFVFAALIILVSAVWAHDEGHKRPDTLPPIGPHGGKYGQLTVHYGEVVVKAEQVTVYILERDIEHIAEDATRVGLAIEIPGKGKKVLKLSKQKDGGYKAAVAIPSLVRRVYFYVSCVLDGKKETGKILYEPRR